jgi:TolB-like protein/Tfp pilus assembly protein PilF
VEQILERLRQRKIVQWALAYLAAAFALIQMLDLVGQRFAWPAEVERALIIVAAVGFVVTLVLAWYHGERGAQRISGGELLILSLLLLIGGGLCWRLARAPDEATSNAAPVDTSAPPRVETQKAAAAGEKSIAVLPLANTSGDPANEYFSDGLSEELISVLARIPDLKIIGRNSSFHFKNTSDDSRTIGQRLGVVNLLEGSVRKQGERVRIAVDLITAADGRQLWAETYDRELKDIFAVQSEIAAAVVAQLKVKLLGGQTAIATAQSNPNLGAYNAFLQGQHLLSRFNEGDQRKAADYFKQATQLDPDYALAYAQLSRTWRSLASSFYADQTVIDEAYARARDAAQKALKLAPNLSEAHSAFGYVLLTPDLDLAAAEAEFRRAVALAPGTPRPADGLAYLLAVQGRLAEAEAMTRQAISLDPYWVSPYLNLARIQMASDRLDEAEATVRKAIDLQHDVSHAYAYLTLIDLKRNDNAAAMRDAGLEPEGFWREYAVTLALQRQDDRAAADAALKALAEKNRYGGPFQIAIIYALRKEPDRVFEWLDQSWTVHDSGLTQLLVTPFLLDYRDDPRFAAIAAKIKLDPALVSRRP